MTTCHAVARFTNDNFLHPSFSNPFDCGFFFFSFVFVFFFPPFFYFNRYLLRRYIMWLQYIRKVFNTNTYVHTASRVPMYTVPRCMRDCIVYTFIIIVPIIRVCIRFKRDLSWSGCCDYVKRPRWRQSRFAFRSNRIPVSHFFSSSYPAPLYIAYTDDDFLLYARA